MDKTNPPQYLGMDLFLNYVVNNLDINLSSYYRWLDDTKEILPASNSIVSMDAMGNLYNTEKITENMKAMYDLREQMQYKILIQK